MPEPVRRPDPICQADMLGYRWQRDQVLQNTRALVEGRPANNVLLYGDSGTGKSALIKSLIHEPGLERLRLVEVDKESFSRLPWLLLCALCNMAGSYLAFFLLGDLDGLRLSDLLTGKRG